MTDKIREEFEKWLDKGNHCGCNENMWKAWQAARTVPEGYVMVPVDLLDRFPELNELNYSHDGVCELNAWGIELVQLLEALE